MVRDLVDQTVARFGRLDAAVNNAGTECKPGPVQHGSCPAATALRGAAWIGRNDGIISPARWAPLCSIGSASWGWITQAADSARAVKLSRRGATALARALDITL